MNPRAPPGSSGPVDSRSLPPGWTQNQAPFRPHEQEQLHEDFAGLPGPQGFPGPGLPGLPGPDPHRPMLPGGVPQSFANDPLFSRIAGFQQAMIASMRDLMVYKLMPDSGKMVVFDSRLQISDALNGLLHHDINCAPVWDSVARRYIGMLTVSDYIDVLRHSFTNPDSAVMSGSSRICDWQLVKRVRGTSIDRLLSLSPESSLYEAAELLTRYRIHRLCILQNGALANTVLAVVSQHAVLGYMIGAMPEFRDFDVPLELLPLGQVHQVCTVGYDTSVIRALDLLNAYQISTLPIVNEHGYLIDSYSRSDAKYLALIRRPDLTMSLRQTLSEIRNTPALPICHPSDSLLHICSLILDTGAHTLICVQEEGGPDGARPERDLGEGSMVSAGSVRDPSLRADLCVLRPVEQARRRVLRLITINEVLCFLIGRPGTKAYFRPDDTVGVDAAAEAEEPSAARDEAGLDPILDAERLLLEDEDQEEGGPAGAELLGPREPEGAELAEELERRLHLRHLQQQRRAGSARFSVPVFSPSPDRGGLPQGQQLPPLGRQISTFSQYLSPQELDEDRLRHQQELLQQQQMQFLQTHEYQPPVHGFYDYQGPGFAPVPPSQLPPPYPLQQQQQQQQQQQPSIPSPHSPSSQAQPQQPQASPQAAADLNHQQQYPSQHLPFDPYGSFGDELAQGEDDDEEDPLFA